MDAVVMQRRVRHRRQCQEAARLLRSAAGERPDVWVTTQAWVPVAGGLARPDVAVLVGAPPVDGLIHHPPVLIVDLAGDEATVRRYLAAGVGEVWSVGAGAVRRHRWVNPSHAATGRLHGPRGAARPGAAGLGAAAEVSTLELAAILDAVSAVDLLACVGG